MRALLIMMMLSSSAFAEVRGRLWNGDAPAGHAVILLDEGSTAAPPPRDAKLDEVWLSFLPKIQVVPPGSSLAFSALDGDSHTVHARYGNETLFNHASVPHGPAQRVVLDQPGVVSVTCDLHEEMRAWVLVSPSRYSAVTDAEGRFTVAAPAGRHQVKVWRPGDAAPIDLGEKVLDGEVELRAPALSEKVVAVAPPLAVAPPHASVVLPAWMLWLSARKAWPAGRAAVVLSIAGAPIGFALAWALFWWSKRRRWSVATGVLLGCALAFGLGGSAVLGLSAAVATGLGFGAFLGTIIGSAHRMEHA